MPSIDSYKAASTSVTFAWPSGLSGVERIMLSAQGDLQRLLSSFFARPITVTLAYSKTSSPNHGLKLLLPQDIAPLAPRASPEFPLIQTRQVRLQCAGRVVCVATSTVRITSSDSARLFLEEKFAIGQVFRELKRIPQFELVSVGMGGFASDTDTSEEEGAFSEGRDLQLWRKYKLETEGFQCEILEVFPERAMFVDCESWLMKAGGSDKPFSRRVNPTLVVIVLWGLTALLGFPPFLTRAFAV